MAATITVHALNGEGRPDLSCFSGLVGCPYESDEYNTVCAALLALSTANAKELGQQFAGPSLSQLSLRRAPSRSRQRH
jgi:hypothetical protein